MNVDLKGSLTAAADEGAERFASRDAAQVIAPATRRVRRNRSLIAVASVMSGAVILVGSMWGLDATGALNRADVPPAAPSTWGPSDGGETVGEVPWSTLNLAAVTEVRRIGEQRADSVAGMICRHDEPEHDPRIAIQEASGDATTTYTTLEDCTAVWFKDGPSTTDSAADASIETSRSASTRLVANATITNTSLRPLAIDTNSIFVWVETAPEETTSEGPSAFAHVVIGPSMWLEAGGTVAVLNSGSDPQIVQPGASFVAVAGGTDGSSDGALADLIAAHGDYTATFWARIHEADPAGDTTYLIQLGGPQALSVDDQ